MTTREEHDARYPEHAKLREARDTLHTEAIAEFVEWCEAHRVFLMRREDGDYPYRVVFDDLIHEYAQIDRNKIESERRAMLDEQRALNNV